MYVSETSANVWQVFHLLLRERRGLNPNRLFSLTTGYGSSASPVSDWSSQLLRGFFLLNNVQHSKIDVWTVWGKNYITAWSQNTIRVEPFVVKQVEDKTHDPVPKDSYSMASYPFGYFLNLGKQHTTLAIFDLNMPRWDSKQTRVGFETNLNVKGPNCWSRGFSVLSKVWFGFCRENKYILVNIGTDGCIHSV